MSTVVCTLFEGHYHYGVAALCNSLHKSGYKGDVYVGYRGELPKWASSAIDNNYLQWQNAKTLAMNGDLKLHFLPLDTDYHLTNYKPDFMLKLFEKFDLSGLFYFDPDIVVNAPFDFLKLWFEAGVALCEDVNSPISDLHPRRVEWRNYYHQFEIELTYKLPYYVNGGFVGLRKENLIFLRIWQDLQVKMGIRIGGLNRSSLVGEALDKKESGPYASFSKTDQDALNCTIEAYAGKVSIIGKEAMGFNSGIAYLPHALGSPKPWKWNFVLQTLKGIPPSQAVKAYWANANGIIKPYSKKKKNIIIAIISTSSFIGRFYRRN